MCRLLAIKTIEGFSPQYLEAFRKLAESGKVRHGAEPGHNDGWGIVLYDGKKPRYLGREPRSASNDPKYLEAMQTLANYAKPGTMIAHLRKAGRNGGSPSVKNTHPFIQDQWAFAHNGGITRFTIWPRGLQGVTDSERFFRLLITRVEKSGTFEEALRWSVSFVKRNFEYSSLNSIVSEGNTLYAYRDCNEDEDYYSLLYRKQGKGLVFSQEPLDDKVWHAVPNGYLAVVTDDIDIEFKSIP